MHGLLGISTGLMPFLVGYLAIRVQRRVTGWSQRRRLQLFVLIAPVISLGLGVGALWHLADQTCFLGAPPLDEVIGTLLPATMSLIALGGLGLGIIRLVLVQRLVSHGRPADPQLQTLANRLARRLHVARPRVWVRPSERPFAMTWGLVRPTILLSTWVLRRLDDHERESVLAHELAHAARRDYLGLWFAMVLRDAFFYLPASRAAYRQIVEEKELACDDLAVSVTERPLALASALAKVWHDSTRSPSVPRPALSLAEPSVRIEGRIRRLLAWSPSSHPETTGALDYKALTLGALATLAILPVVNVLVLFVPMGCGPFVHLLGS